MEYLEITNPDDFRAVAIYKSYCTTFPEDERRSEKQFRALFPHQKVRVLAVLHELENIGYLICWELSDFVFIEHFEIFPEFRGKKYGSQIVADLFKKYSRIILEVEPADLNEDATRRIYFYGENGFSVVDETYMQPAYSPEKEQLKLWLLANWQPEKTDWIKEEIYDVVYC